MQAIQVKCPPQPSPCLYTTALPHCTAGGPGLGLSTGAGSSGGQGRKRKAAEEEAEEDDDDPDFVMGAWGSGWVRAMGEVAAEEAGW